MRPLRKAVRAGVFLMALGALHLAATLALSAQYIPGWLRLDLWLSNNPDLKMSALPPEAGAFWLSYGSFGLPLLLLGALVRHLGKRGQAAPAFIGWAVGGWAALGAYLIEPTPFLLGIIPAVMIVQAARTRPDQSTAEPATLPTA